MVNFYKYLPVSNNDQEWGLEILHAGYSEYKPGQNYPDLNHPSHHHFDWKKGRILQEYSLVYITSGKGVYHSARTGNIEIAGGCAMMIFPNERHLYHPDVQTGWTEYWIGFDGTHISNLINKKIFSPSQPVFRIGYHETIIHLLTETIEAIKEEKPGYQPLICGSIMYILGQLFSSAKQQLLPSGNEENIVNSARSLIRTNLQTGISPQEIAGRLGVGYSHFRKIFKEYTGMAPVQYQIQLKLERAKEELVNTSKSVKEIAFGLNFESSQYFSSLFKEKTHLSPLAFRKRFGK